MNIDLVSLFSFAIITTFTPGPNNISSASMGILYGYKKTLPYLLGISVGFFVVMIVCASLSSTILKVFPASEKYLRWVGGIYIFWLAIGIWKSDYAISEKTRAPKAFLKGFVLQLFNPKGIVYGLTLYTSFLTPISSRPVVLAFFAVGFALVAFAAISTWTLCGAGIKIKLKNVMFRKTTNGLLALLLIYTAVDISKILTQVKSF